MTMADRWVPRLLRPLLALVGALLLLVAVPDPAAGHTRTEETTNLDSRLVAVPDLPGVTWTVHTGGLLVEVVNEGDGVLIVEGYDGEPYLRIGPEGVARNARSSATYLNRERLGDVAIPPSVDPQADPDWVHLSDEPRTTWHDHRTHWMSTAPPPFVDAGPLARTLMDMEWVGVIGRAGADAGTFQAWSIPVLHDGQRYEVRGEMAWEDPPSPLPYLGLAALLVLPALWGLRGRDLDGILRPAALVVGAVAAINGIHLIDDVVAWPSEPLDELFGLLHTTTFLVGGLGGAIWAWRGRFGRVLALSIGAGSILYHQGLVHLPMLFASQFPTVWPDGLVRFTVALGAVQALAVAPVVLRARRAGEGSTGEGLREGAADNRRPVAAR